MNVRGGQSDNNSLDAEQHSLIPQPNQSGTKADAPITVHTGLKSNIV